MQDSVHLALYEYVVRYIVFLEGKIFIPYQVGDILRVAGDEIIEPDNQMPLAKKAVA
jgi:hypothetical protein